MSRPKITIVGTLRFTEDEGLKFSTEAVEPRRTVWWEALEVNEWAGVGKCPEPPEFKSFYHIPVPGPERSAAFEAAKQQYERDREAYFRAVHSDSKYKQAAQELLDLQMREPQPLIGHLLWAYRGYAVRFLSTEPEDVRNEAKNVLLIKHYVLQRDRRYERVRREVEALENMEKLESVSREPIPENVRLFVWQRDGGQCVKCGSRERLEFDHIIPIAAGGSNTERNVQLLCETCNRSKGATI